MKNLNTFAEFLNEAKKTYSEIASELVEIAASYTDVDLTSALTIAKRSSTDVLVIHVLETLKETLADEGVKPNELKEFEKECLAFLKKMGIKL